MDDDDDWLISSLDRYEQLFMYELSTPVHFMQWTNNGEGVWAYGESSADKNELLRLRLPDKITDKTITGGRDFKLTEGAIIPFPISCLQELSNQQIVVSNADNQSLHWWKQDCDNPDILLEVSSVAVSSSFKDLSSPIISFLDWMSDSSNNLLLGRRKPGLIQLYDTTSHEVVWENVLGVELHGVCYYGNRYQLVSCRNVTGDIHIDDVRVTSSNDQELPSETLLTQRYILSLSSSSSSTISTLSDSGLLRMYDTRSLQEPFYSVSIATTFGTSSQTSLTISPHSDTMIGVSGLAPGIGIYNTTTNPPTAVFIHDGHEKEGAQLVRVQTHIWHPVIPRLLLSAANDSGLHVWQYNDDI